LLSIESLEVSAKCNRLSFEVPWFDKASNFCLHYILRPSSDRKERFKPPTKSLVAALSGSLVVGSRSDLEVVSWLGADYPYLADSNSLSDVQAVVDYALQTCRLGDGSRAQSAMNSLREKLCLGKIMQYYYNAFSRIKSIM
jgi:hypothetical protein